MCDYWPARSRRTKMESRRHHGNGNKMNGQYGAPNIDKLNLDQLSLKPLHTFNLYPKSFVLTWGAANKTSIDLGRLASQIMD